LVLRHLTSLSLPSFLSSFPPSLLPSKMGRRRRV
jgi:hypothetical protein